MVTPDGRLAVVGTKEPDLHVIDLADLSGPGRPGDADLATARRAHVRLRSTSSNLARLTAVEWLDGWRALLRRRAPGNAARPADAVARGRESTLLTVSPKPVGGEMLDGLAPRPCARARRQRRLGRRRARLRALLRAERPRRGAAAQDRRGQARMCWTDAASTYADPDARLPEATMPFTTGPSARDGEHRSLSPPPPVDPRSVRQVAM